MSGAKANLLALDTSTRQVGLAIYDGVRVLAEVTWTSLDYHTVELAPAVVDLLDKAQLAVKNLAALGVAIGPGSFTGLRIGLALAKGLALAQKLPIIGIPTLDILAAALPARDIPLAAVLQAGRGRLAVGWYDPIDGAWQASERPTTIWTPEELLVQIETPTLICGELTDEERGYFERKKKVVVLATPAQCARKPSYLAELAWRKWQSGKIDDPVSLSPIYLHYATPIPG